MSRGEVSRKKSSIVGELPGLVLTASRLVLAKNIADRLKEGRPYAAQMAASAAINIATAFANVRDLGKKHPNGVRNL